jgi:DNA topoisomerase-1
MARLRHVSSEALTVSRQRRGRAFSYFDAAGEPIRDREAIRRFRDLAVPPAWQEVRLSPDARSHIQATGVDGAGRLQYIYHAEWQRRRERKKLRQLTMLAAALPRIRRRVRRDLDAEAGSRELALAVGVALIDRTAMRVGRERYLSAHGTRGAGTLFARDVSVHGDRVRIRFPAKSGKQAVYDLDDPVLASAIVRLKAVAGRYLLMWWDETGAARPIRTEGLVAYLHDIAGDRVTPKDFRTLHASALAGEALARLERGETPTRRKRQLGEVVRTVAAFLQNTPAVCRGSYIAPCLFELFESGRLTATWADAAAPPNGHGLRQREARLAALLEAVA